MLGAFDCPPTPIRMVADYLFMQQLVLLGQIMRVNSELDSFDDGNT